MRKWTLRQNEWYRDNKKLLPSQILDLGRFFRENNELWQSVLRLYSELYSSIIGKTGSSFE